MQKTSVCVVIRQLRLAFDIRRMLHTAVLGNLETNVLFQTHAQFVSATTSKNDV